MVVEVALVCGAEGDAFVVERVEAGAGGAQLAGAVCAVVVGEALALASV